MIAPTDTRSSWAPGRYPALVVAASWSAALAATVVLAPGQPALGALAVALAVLCLGLSVAMRPALLAFAVAAALMGLGRAELPAADATAATSPVKNSLRSIGGPSKFR